MFIEMEAKHKAAMAKMCNEMEAKHKAAMTGMYNELRRGTLQYNSLQLFV